jgi:cilia- and flagella-associated protein 298
LFLARGLGNEMVKLHVKKGEDSQFLYETSVESGVEETLKCVCNIYNGRLKIDRLCSEIDYLSKSGISLPPNMQGLTDEQIQELKLVDEWSNTCTPSGGYVEQRDEMGHRNGRGAFVVYIFILKKKTIKL